MDPGRKPSKFLANRNNKIYMDLKDIIREHALPFLPAKSLRRFTGVCRDWRLIISAPFFAHTQSNAFRAITGLFVQSQGDSPSFISLDPMSCGVPDPSLEFLPDPVDIRSSSNGLLCCKGLTGDNAYYICNPVTKQWKKLPKPNADHGHDPAVVLIFEPSRLNFVAEYKVVCVFSSADFDSAHEFEIYSSAQGSWRISGEICFGQNRILPRSGVHANGIVYWQGGNSGVLAFDLTMERSQLIYSALGTLGVMGGKLCSASMYGNQVSIKLLNNAYTNTMQMGSYAETWKTKENGLCGFFDTAGLFDKASSIAFVGDDVVVVKQEKALHSYDLKTKEVKSLGTFDYNARVVGYVNSLVEL